MTDLAPAPEVPTYVVPAPRAPLPPATTAPTTAPAPATVVVLPRRHEPSAAHLVKEVWERAFAALALLLVLPLLAVLVLLVRADGNGRAVFRQVRVGRDGREFVLHKLRTMHHDAEARLAELADRNEAGAVLFKLRDDPRITPWGRVLRRYSLDELPQLWDVVRGEMALVGPRPALPHEVEAYPPALRRRLHVKPGLTGLWQVSGRSDLSWEESQRLDLRYVDEWSLRLDLGIVLRTFRAVLGHRGAY